MFSLRRVAPFAFGGAAAACYVASEYRDFVALVNDAALFEDKLPNSIEAKSTRVVKVPGLLSELEIATLTRWAEANASRLGTAGRTSANMSAAYRTGAWETWYLNTDGRFRAEHGALLRKLIDATVAADAACSERPLLRQNGGAIDAEALRPRCVEFHTVQRDGSLPFTEHHDVGSVLTIDVMLSTPGTDFKGGAFSTAEPSGEQLVHSFGRGEALVFHSHKPHCVAAVTSGERRVLVMELWEGVERTCAHRCDKHLGECNHTALRSFWRRALSDIASDSL